MQKINLILGTMQFGESVLEDEVLNFLKEFFSYGFQEIDTAFIYNDGASEKLIGEALSNFKIPLKIATKVTPKVTGKLDKETILYQFDKSLSRLRLQNIDVLYLHFPSLESPLYETLETCAYLHNEGKFNELGLSNFPSWLVSEAVNICKHEKWILPTIYQGLYNPLSRHAEDELNRALDYYGLRFYAYNPLAGGLMTEKYGDKILKKGRFTQRPNYLKRYWHNSYFEALSKIESSCDEYGISITEATFRWLSFHSMLNTNRGDGIILGASKIEHIHQNIEYVNNGPLPEEIVKTINETWNITKQDAPIYFTL